MGTGAKVAIVLAGYALAFVAASATVYVYVAATPVAHREGSDGMLAFGDSVVFLGALGLGALPATGAALYFLRGWRPLWFALTGFAVLATLAAWTSLGGWLARYPAAPGGWAQLWIGLFPLFALAAPVVALATLLAALIAPARSFRLVLLGVTASQALVFAVTVLQWMIHR